MIPGNLNIVKVGEIAIRIYNIVKAITISKKIKNENSKKNLIFMYLVCIIKMIK